MARRIAYALVALEVVGLAVFFLSTWKEQSLLPGSGGGGDAASIFLWKDRAGLALSALVSLWLLALVRVLYLAVRNEREKGFLLANMSAFDAHAVAVPVIGLFAGYLLLQALG